MDKIHVPLIKMANPPRNNAHMHANLLAIPLRNEACISIHSMTFVGLRLLKLPKKIYWWRNFEC
jgi:hypothetical protein